MGQMMKGDGKSKLQPTIQSANAALSANRNQQMRLARVMLSISD
jgi:hypothetical protein